MVLFMESISLEYFYITSGCRLLCFIICKTSSSVWLKAPDDSNFRVDMAAAKHPASV